jgi:hypothetical protein
MDLVLEVKRKLGELSWGLRRGKRGGEFVDGFGIGVGVVSVGRGCGPLRRRGLWRGVPYLLSVSYSILKVGLAILDIFRG